MQAQENRPDAAVETTPFDGDAIETRQDAHKQAYEAPSILYRATVVGITGERSFDFTVS